MQVCIVSAFRNASNYISRYCEQMDELQEMLNSAGISLHLVLGYGDSNDGTGEILFEECSHRFCCSLIDVSHGGHHYGSIISKQRFRQLAHIGNLLWGAIPVDANVVGLVESDLIWSAGTLKELIERVKPSMIHAPMVMHQDGRFYDTWAFSRGGIKFRNKRPYHPDFLEDQVVAKRFYEMDSVGSVFFTKASLARQLYWPEEDVVVGLCKQARDLGANIVLDSYLQVYHP